MSVWTDYTSWAVRDMQSNRIDHDDTESLYDDETDPDDDCLGEDGIDRGPEQFDFYD